VILATKWVDVPKALKGIDWHGRILVDATNAHKGSKPDRSRAGVTRSRAALKGRTSSEIVAEDGRWRAACEINQQHADGMDMGLLADQTPDRHLYVRGRRRSQTKCNRVNQQQPDSSPLISARFEQAVQCKSSALRYRALSFTLSSVFIVVETGGL